MVKAKVLKQLRKRIEKAERIANPLADVDDALLALKLPASKALTIDYRLIGDLTDDLKQACLDIFSANMASLYEKSSFGLDLAAKADELRHRKARYLLINGDDDKLAAFVHFRIEMDEEESPEYAVVYVYEIQVHADYQRLGLGQRLMQAIESMATTLAMDKVMLTVFRSNTAAMDFYQRLDYEIDESSPSRHEQEADYEILSKRISIA